MSLTDLDAIFFNQWDQLYISLICLDSVLWFYPIGCSLVNKIHKDTYRNVLLILLVEMKLASHFDLHTRACKFITVTVYKTLITGKQNLYQFNNIYQGFVKNPCQAFLICVVVSLFTSNVKVNYICHIDILEHSILPLTHKYEAPTGQTRKHCCRRSYIKTFWSSHSCMNGETLKLETPITYTTINISSLLVKQFLLMWKQIVLPQPIFTGVGKQGNIYTKQNVSTTTFPGFPRV